MIAHLRRRWLTNRATEGTLDIDAARVCFTLEDRSRGLRADMPLSEIRARKVDKQTAIPTGRYRLTLEHSPKFGPDTLTIKDVSGFDYIRIHAGNSPEDTEGCPLVGLDRTSPTDAWIASSAAALKALKALVVPRLKSGEEAWIEVSEVPETDERT